MELFTLHSLRFGQELPHQWLDAALLFLMCLMLLLHHSWAASLPPVLPALPLGFAQINCISALLEKREGIYPNVDEFLKSDLAFRSSL